MAKLSRMKKYEAYRNQIAYGNEESLASDDLADFSNRLNRIDSSLAQDVTRTNPKTVKAAASRMRTYDSVDQARGNHGATTSTMGSTSAKNESFKNEYLDEFLDEVKKYNVEQGYAQNEDTQLNIISSLKPNRRLSSSNDSNQTDVPKIRAYQNGNALYEDGSTNASVNASNASVRSSANEAVMDERELAAVQASVLDKRNSITQELQSLLNDDSPVVQTNEDHGSTNITEEDEPQVMQFKNNKPSNATFDMSRNSAQRQKELLEQTAKQAVRLAQQYDEMDENLDDIEDKVGHNTRLVNFILVLIVIALVVILVVIIYAILLMKGVI